MKKIALILLTVACFVFFNLGCSEVALGSEPDMNGTPIITESDSPTQISISKETQTTEEEDTWGIGLTANHISHNGLTLVFTQSDGEPTGELQTGSPFWLEKFADGQWEAVETVIPANEIAWTMEAYLIPKNDSINQKINWAYLYGELPAGNYRIGKEVMDFRKTGDYDLRTYYASFDIQN